ncbi:hypothetical protein OIU77_015277 [Salix suchowensis]|uniref:Uncharacterized protein n=1 Tax=Salix suchowensis TaxID=1278906 RepID=A0ABQ8ZS78_9ROSI|nr:hypothetical protein OIU77_015277 [Salix suchowensis]
MPSAGVLGQFLSGVVVYWSAFEVNNISAIKLAWLVPLCMIQNRKSTSQLKLLDAQPRLAWLVPLCMKAGNERKKHTQALLQILSLRVNNIDKVTLYFESSILF